MAVLVNPQTGQAFDVADEDAEGAIASMDLQRATPEQVDWLRKQREYEAKPLGEKALETAGTAFAGAAAIGGEIGKLIPESLGGLSPEEARQSDEFVRSEQVQELRERHPTAFALGAGAPAMGVGEALGGGIGAMLAESGAVGVGEEAINRTQHGREFDPEQAAGIAQQDFAFSALANAATKVAGRIGNLFLFGTGNTMARNVKRGLDESAGAIVPDDVRFDSPLLEAETRSTRAAAAASPGMPPGPERDELLRRAAADLNQQVETQGGELFASTVGTARQSASTADSDLIGRRIDDLLTETTPAQTAWSADATRKLDEMRSALRAAGDEPVAAPFVTRAAETADEAIRAIDGAGDSAAWFKASSRARDRLDALAEEIADSDLPETGIVARSIGETRDYLARNLADRSLFGGAAEMDAGLRGAARDRIGAAVRSSGGDLRAQLSAFLAADAAERSALRGPLEQAIEGFEELAQAHERFGTATPGQIERLRENAATLRRGISLADDIQGAVSRGSERVREATREAAARGPDYNRAEDIAGRVRARAAEVGRRAVGKAAQKAVDFASGPGREVYDEAVDEVLRGAVQSVGAAAGATLAGGLVGGPVGLVGGWFAGRALGKRYSASAAKSILDAAKRYVQKYGADTAGVALLGAAALDEGDDDDGLGAAAASAGGLLFARRFARRALDLTSSAAGAVGRGARAAGEAVVSGAEAAGRGAYRASEAATGAVDAVTGRATEALGRGSYAAGRAVGESAGAGLDAAARVAADETRVRRLVGAAAGGVVSGAAGPFGRAVQREVARSAADYFGPRISRVALEWLEKRAGKTTAETVQEAVQETAAAARRDPLLLPAHTEQAGALVDDLGTRVEAAMRETPEQRAAALGAFPQRLGGSALDQRGALSAAVDELVAGLSQVSEPGAAEAAAAFAAKAREAIKGARSVQDRFRIGMQLTETLAEHTARAGDSEMGKVFGAYTERMWETMSRRELWMGRRELEREAKRQGKQRELLLGRLSRGEMIGLAAVGGAGAAAAAQLGSEDQDRGESRVAAAERIVSIDDAATQRIRHTARILAGLAEPPGPEGLTTALARFGAEHDDPRAAFEERKAILQKAEISPALVYDVIGATFGDVARVSPELYQAAAARLLDGFRYMRENLPPEVKTSLLYPTGLPPSESAMRDWATQWNTVMDPESVLDDIDNGTVTHLQIRTLEGAHPDTYQQLRTETISEVGANFADIPTSTKMQLDILFQADGLAGPMFSSAAAAMIGEASRAASMRKQPMPAEAGANDQHLAAGPSGMEAIKSSVTNRGV